MLATTIRQPSRPFRNILFNIVDIPPSEDVAVPKLPQIIIIDNLGLLSVYSGGWPCQVLLENRAAVF